MIVTSMKSSNFSTLTRSHVLTGNGGLSMCDYCGIPDDAPITLTFPNGDLHAVCSALTIVVTQFRLTKDSINCLSRFSEACFAAGEEWKFKQSHYSSENLM